MFLCLYIGRLNSLQSTLIKHFCCVYLSSVSLNKFGMLRVCPQKSGWERELEITTSWPLNDEIC